MDDSKSKLYTITVSREGDPRHPGEPAVAARLTKLIGTGEPAVYKDDVYFIRLPGDAGRSRVEDFAREFLAGDPSRRASVAEQVEFPASARQSIILVLRKPGVMDPIEGSVLHALRDAGFESGAGVKTARRYRIAGCSPTRDALQALAQSTLANTVVDEVHCFLAGEEEQLADPFRAHGESPARRLEVPIAALDGQGLAAVSQTRGLSLVEEEMLAIQGYFRGIGRAPTELELETIAQTWSEHCCHKTLTGPIEYDGHMIQNLLKETIFAVTKELNRSFCLSVFRDNAGIIAIDDQWALTFKVETHNHPSALEPYGGAGTGVGGVIRDTLGTGLGALPVLSTDVFCFGPLDAGADELPAGTLHPLRLLTGVVAGVRDYGNRMGIPTANGAIHFHPGYVGNPLVFCGSVGLLPRDRLEKRARAGHLIVACGGRTGRDGIHGATFSSRELTDESELISAGAVQIGNPIEEKKVQDALIRARDERLFSSVTDCGAGGFSSAVGEMAAELGAEVELGEVPLKYPGLGPTEVWISEAQERMVLAVPPENKRRLFEILREEEVEGCVLGTFTGSKILRVKYRGELAGELSMEFLHQGRPQLRRIARKTTAPPRADLELQGRSVQDVFCELLRHPTIASKEPVIRQYDHEVQGRMVLRPLTGPRGDAPNDACAFDPLRNGSSTVVIGCGMTPILGEINPFEMGAQSVDEAVRNVIASGGSLERLALLDNFAWGNVNDPVILGACVECARGAAMAARAYEAPFISGKDSLHNTYRSGGVSRSIPHTFLVSAVSIVPGAPRAPSTDLKRSGSELLLLGPNNANVAGSLTQLLLEGTGGHPASFQAALAPAIVRHLEEWIRAGRVLACHDLSDGGLAIAAAEMGMGGEEIGVHLELRDLIPARSSRFADFDLLFGEGPHRYLLEVTPAETGLLFELAKKGEIPLYRVGKVTSDEEFLIEKQGRALIKLPLREVREHWRSALAGIWGMPA